MEGSQPPWPARQAACGRPAFPFRPAGPATGPKLRPRPGARLRSRQTEGGGTGRVLPPWNTRLGDAECHAR